MVLPSAVLVMPLLFAAATGLEGAVQAARADAAQRTGLPAGSIALVNAEAVTWPDGSLGCPQPGMNYTMALVPGYRVKLRVDAKLFDYHASVHGALVLCPPEHSTDPVPDGRS